MIRPTDACRVRRLVEFIGQRKQPNCPARKLAPRCCEALPMTKVTAIVSPSARPRPSIMPPMTPAPV